ncbi:hypothetical protein J7L05_05885 [bacterium]|nr:hypothetical protein [bacterium]
MRFVTPSVDKDTAFKNLTRKRKRLFAAASKQAPLKIELINFPHYIFTLTISVESGNKEIDVAADGIVGLFSFLKIEELSLDDKSDFPTFAWKLSTEQAKEKVVAEYRWILIKHGIHNRELPKIIDIRDSKLFYPFWVGYYPRGDGLDFNAIDAISAAPIGIKMRRSFLVAFAQKKTFA